MKMQSPIKDILKRCTAEVPHSGRSPGCQVVIPTGNQKSLLTLLGVDHHIVIMVVSP
jgi:hypothetical protein